MGLTGGVKSHRLSGQISPYCEKKRHWLCAYCAPMFYNVALNYNSPSLWKCSVKLIAANKINK